MKNVKVFYNEKSGNNDEDKVLKTIKDFFARPENSASKLEFINPESPEDAIRLAKSQSRPNRPCGCFSWRWNHQ